MELGQNGREAEIYPEERAQTTTGLADAGGYRELAGPQVTNRSRVRKESKKWHINPITGFECKLTARAAVSRKDNKGCLALRSR